nr:putative ribonuclease H-like domain-containing protein [Tanacetum cinerariifolium]
MPTKIELTLEKSQQGVSNDVLGNPQMDLQEKEVIDSGCLRHMTGNMSYLRDYEKIGRGYVAFGGNPKGRKITSKGTIKTGKLDFENVYFVKELKFNIFSVSQMCDKKNSFLFNDTECVVLSPDFKLTDENHVLLRVPRKNNMYSVDLKNNITKGDQEENNSVNSTNRANAISSTVNAASNEVNVVGRKASIKLHDDLNMPELEDISIFEDSNEDVFGANADLNNLESTFQGHTQEEGIDYDEVFALVARIEAIRLFLTYASFKDFEVYQMDVKSAFIYGKIKEEVYICQPLGFEDPDFPSKVYKVEKALYGLHQAPRAWSMRELAFFLGLKVNQKEDGIFISQDNYVAKILKKFVFFEVKTASTPMETQKPLLKDEDGEEVDVHIYRLMIGSLMYLTSSSPDIMFVVCAYAIYHVNPKVSHLHAVKRILRYLQGPSKLGLWYPKDSPFDLMAYTDSDYAGASLDRKSTIGGCQFLMCRLISWQCKKQTVIANSTTKSEYVAASNKQLDGLPTHKEKYDVLFHTKKVFAYMKRIGKGFSGKETQLFPTMGRIDEIDADEDISLVSTHDDVSTQDNIVQDEGIKDVGVEEVVKVVTTTKMVIDAIVNVAHVTTALTITAESTKTNVEVTQNVEDDKESKELKQCLEIMQDDGDDVTIDDAPLSTNKMLKIFNREDLEVLCKLVKDKFVKTMSVDHMDSFLLHNLKTMFDHHVEDNV